MLHHNWCGKMNCFCPLNCFMSDADTFIYFMEQWPHGLKLLVIFTFRCWFILRLILSRSQSQLQRWEENNDGKTDRHLAHGLTVTPNHPADFLKQRCFQLDGSIKTFTFCTSLSLRIKTKPVVLSASVLLSTNHYHNMKVIISSIKLYFPAYEMIIFDPFSSSLSPSWSPLWPLMRLTPSPPTPRPLTPLLTPSPTTT